MFILLSIVITIIDDFYFIFYVHPLVTQTGGSHVIYPMRKESIQIQGHYQERQSSSQSRRELKSIAITCGFIVAIIFSIAASMYASSLVHNGAYKAVAWFLALIFDSNLTSKYLGWAIHR